MKIRAGDSVVVISGKDKGKTGQVLRVLHEKNRVVVADINMRTRHIRKGPQRPGEIVKYEASIDASNVMLVDSKTKKRTRAGYKVEKGKKIRYAKKSGEEIKKTTIAAKKGTDKAAVEKAEAKVATKKGAEGTEGTKVKQGPFWKKMGFGADEIAGDAAEVDTTSHMREDHSVPDQIERSSSRSSGRGA
ncbi:MAG: 50S ribosomal protein L24 [Candidatus Peregrinibacteria bacterium]|nr:50S ribosomal protein L24 [Candidatus Peregrinibacteria bacterium]MCB9807735.1 50S ribosomal protein L24 [Candidatus Peribacteria bacterium]